MYELSGRFTLRDFPVDDGGSSYEPGKSTELWPD